MDQSVIICDNVVEPYEEDVEAKSYNKTILMEKSNL